MTEVADGEQEGAAPAEVSSASHSKERKKFLHVVGGVVKEVGILWFAFGTLEPAMKSESVGPWWYAQIVVVSGCFVVLGIELERRHD